MFTAKHFIWLALCAAAITIGLIAAKKLRLSSRAASRVMACVCIASEVTKIMDDMISSDAGGSVLDPRSLPFHLCSMMIFAIFYLALSGNEQNRRRVLGFVAPIGLLGGVCAMLIPTNGVRFNYLPAYQCFVYHAALVWFALYSIIAKQVDLGVRTYRRNLLVLTVLVFGMIYVNSALSVYDTNFMYLRRPPMDGLPLLNLDHGWYVYFITLVLLGVVLVSAVHLPFLLAEKRRKAS